MPQPQERSPDAALLDMERELVGLLYEYEALRQARPKMPRVMDRYEAGSQMDRALTRVHKLQRRIAATQAETLAGAAVQLRRLGAVIEDYAPEAAQRLLVSALGAVQRATGG